MTFEPRPLWPCPECGREFANRNQVHACATHDPEVHFLGKSPAVRTLYEAFEARVRALGPVIVVPEKTRIAFQVRMSFAAIVPRKDWLAGHLVLARRAPDGPFRRIDSISHRNHVHHFRISSVNDLTPTFEAFLREAYDVGCQQHLERPSSR